MDEVTPKVAVIIPTWNRRDDLLACLKSVVAMGYPRLHVIVVDNGSTDGTAEAVQAAFPAVEVIRREQNRGFAAGCNLGLQRALQRGVDYVLLLNNDVVIAPDMLARLVEVAVAHPEVGLLGPSIWYHDAPQRLWSAGYRCRPVTLSEQPPQGDPHGAEPYFVDTLYGCGVLIRREVLDTVGLLDGRFFMYYEDKDLCLRARAAGWKLMAVPGARMWHKVSPSTSGRRSLGTPFQKYHMARSSVLFFAKHTPRWLWPVVIPYRLGSGLRTVARALRHGRADIAAAYVRGLWHGLRLLRAHAKADPTPVAVRHGRQTP
jgi:hypothetical protein